MIRQCAVVNANVVSPDQISFCDLGIVDGKVHSILPAGSLSGNVDKLIDAKGAYVTPGGVDCHVHLSQELMKGGLTLPYRGSDDFASGTRSAVAGGTTTVIAFAMQYKSQSHQTLADVIEEYHAIAKGQCYSDYAFHLILSDPRPAILEELSTLIPKHGISSVKLYMTYEGVRLGDLDLLKIMDVARKCDITPLVHAENADMITFLTEKLESASLTAPIHHASSRPPLVETEAANRALALSQLMDIPILLVHVSAPDTVALLRKAQTGTSNHNSTTFAETCPQYLVLTEADLDQEGFEGAKCVCSPPLRKNKDGETIKKLWGGLDDGTFTIVSSDHCPTSYNDPRGKKAGLSPTTTNAEHGNFKLTPNGLPGVETRLPLLYTHGVLNDNISIEKFVEVTSTNPAKLYGLYPKKGILQPGSDADLVIWWKQEDAPCYQLANHMLHHACDYTPYEGMQFNNWPKYTMLRGEIVWAWEDGQKSGEIRGREGGGTFQRRGPSYWGQQRRKARFAENRQTIGNGKLGSDWRP
jgi:dihydropyrimidinase